MSLVFRLVGFIWLLVIGDWWFALLVVNSVDFCFLFSCFTCGLCVYLGSGVYWLSVV